MYLSTTPNGIKVKGNVYNLLGVSVCLLLIKM